MAKTSNGQGASHPQKNDLSFDSTDVARMYDYYLGDKDNFAADRTFADEMIRQAPQVRDMAGENRAFLRRAARHLVGEAGIDQFLDIGAGLPMRDNVHQVAQRTNRNARVVYVDDDPMVFSHAWALLSADSRTWVLKQDVRAPEKILSATDALGLLDLSRPVAVMLVAVLHFVTDEEDPYRIVRTLMSALPAGSYLVLSHVERRRDLERAASGYRRVGSPVVPRTAKEILGLFEGTALVDPGLVPVGEWRPDIPAYLDRRVRVPNCGGVGRTS